MIINAESKSITLSKTMTEVASPIHFIEIPNKYSFEKRKQSEVKNFQLKIPSIEMEFVKQIKKNTEKQAEKYSKIRNSPFYVIINAIIFGIVLGFILGYTICKCF